MLAHSGSEDYPVLAHSGSEDYPVLAHSGSEDYPVLAHSGSESTAETPRITNLTVLGESRELNRVRLRLTAKRKKGHLENRWLKPKVLGPLYRLRGDVVFLLGRARLGWDHIQVDEAWWRYSLEVSSHRVRGKRRVGRFLRERIRV